MSWGKQSKDRLTALACANMSGTDKLPMSLLENHKILVVSKMLCHWQLNMSPTKKLG